MKRFRIKFSYANVIATLALFLALGGGAYAATQLPKESVGVNQLKRGAVTPIKLSNASKAALTGPTGARGLQGPKGEQGNKGEPGPSTGAAGGALSGSYPDPSISTAARGVALAGVSSSGGIAPTTGVYFNRLGGTPTITRSSLGKYAVSFPGLSPVATSNVILMSQGANESQVTASTNAGQVVVTVRSPAGALEDNFFSVTVFGGSTTG